MSQYKPMRGSYWEHYAVPECEARCMARRTLHEAFGGCPTLNAPPSAPRRSWPWACACVAAVLAVLTVLACGMYPRA